MTVQTDGADTPPGKRRLAGLGVWISLIGSAIGIVSAFKEFIPTLTRLSMITKGLFAVYHIGRDYAWHGLRTAFGWLHVQIPDISPLSKDGIVVASLIFAALNFESVRKHKERFITSFFRNTATAFLNAFRNSVEPVTGLFDSSGPGYDAIILFSLAICFFVEGYGIFLLLRAYGAGFGSSWYYSPVPQALVLAVGVWMVATASANLRRFGGAAGSFFNRISHLVLIPIVFIGIPLFALRNGWRSVLLAVGIVAALVGLNYAFLLVIDPMLIHPPAWLQQLINADPATLPKAQ